MFFSGVFNTPKLTVFSSDIFLNKNEPRQSLSINFAVKYNIASIFFDNWSFTRVEKSNEFESLQKIIT